MFMPCASGSVLQPLLLTCASLPYPGALGVRGVCRSAAGPMAAARRRVAVAERARHDDAAAAAVPRRARRQAVEERRRRSAEEGQFRGPGV